MSTTVIDIMDIVWLVVLLIGMLFNIANIIDTRPVVDAALTNPQDAEAILLARGHLRPELERLVIILLFITMGLTVIVRQGHLISHDEFDALFYGALELGGIILSIKPIRVWIDHQKLLRLDAQRANDTKKGTN